MHISGLFNRNSSENRSLLQPAPSGCWWNCNTWFSLVSVSFSKRSWGVGINLCRCLNIHSEMGVFCCPWGWQLEAWSCMWNTRFGVQCSAALSEGFVWAVDAGGGGDLQRLLVLISWLGVFRFRLETGWPQFCVAIGFWSEIWTSQEMVRKHDSDLSAGSAATPGTRDEEVDCGWR